MRRAFSAFAEYLDARPMGESADADLGSMGHPYLRYARARPLQYRLMFGTPLPDPSQHPAMMASAQHAFALLRDGLVRMHAEAVRALPREVIEEDALFVWATLHGHRQLGARARARARGAPTSAPGARVGRHVRYLAHRRCIDGAGTMHIRLAYSFGVDAVASGAAMGLVVPPVAAWFAGHVLLPLALRTQRFPREAVAPPEVRPSPCDALGLTPRDASAQLAVIATHAAAALHTADHDRPSVRVVHAYFGALPPCTALRLLSAHTRHHTAAIRVLRARA